MSDSGDIAAACAFILALLGLAALLAAVPSADDPGCRERFVALGDSCHPDARAELVGDKVICRCPPFAPMPSGSAKR